jgi:hypothetical protein
MNSGTRVIIGDEEVELQWGDRQFSKTIKISKLNNIPIMQSAPGFQRFKTFTANISQEDQHIACFDAHIIPDNESMVQDDLLPDEVGDSHQSATSHQSRDEAPTLNNRVMTPESGTAPKVVQEQPNLIESFEDIKSYPAAAGL